MGSARWRRLPATVLQEENFHQIAAKEISVQALVAKLKTCSRAQDLQRGKTIHAEAVACGHDSNIYVLSTLVRMYAKCGSIADARRVFDSIQKPNVVSWTTLILGYAENGEGLTALDMFERMKASGCVPDSITYLAALKACTSLALHGNGSRKKNCLQRGREIHLEVGSNIDHYVQNMLIDMYSTCGSMVDARCVFDSIQKPDVVSWTALLLGYAKNGEGLVAMDMFSRMKASGYAPNSVTYVAALKACTSLAVDGDGSGKKNSLEWGKKIHLEIGSNLDVYIQSTLIDMYAKSGSVVDARRVFDSIQKPNAVCWNALLSGYAENGEGLVTLDMFRRMKSSGCAPNCVTYLAALKACISLAVNGGGSGKKICLERGREIHLEIGRNSTLYIQSTLIDMYATCGCMADARRVFDSVQNRDVVCWNALLLGYAENGEGLVALDLFSRMKASECAPNSVTYVAAIKACMSLALDVDDNGKKACLEKGREIHSEIGSNLDVYIQSMLIDMYAKCGSIVDARCMFDSIQKPNVLCWNALLMGYTENGEGLAALALFATMKASGCAPNPVTYVAALKACTSLAVDGEANCLEWGRDIHLEIGSRLDLYIQSSLIEMYAKCGSTFDARRVFDNIQKPNVGEPDCLSYEQLIAAYLTMGKPELASALEVLDCMRSRSLKPSFKTYCELVNACWQSSSADGAEKCFSAMINAGYTADAKIFHKMMQLSAQKGDHSRTEELFQMLKQAGIQPTSTCYEHVLHAYCKAGQVNQAFTVFRESKQVCKPSIPVYNMLLDACSKSGSHLQAMQLFNEICHSGMKANAVTYTSAITALVRSGRYTKAEELYRKMLKHRISPTVHTYTSMVNSYTVRGWTRLGHELCLAMRNSNCVITSVAYNAMLNLYLRGGWYTEGAQVLREMDDKGVEPGVAGYGVLISSCGDSSPTLSPVIQALQWSQWEMCQIIHLLLFQPFHEKPEALLEGNVVGLPSEVLRFLKTMAQTRDEEANLSFYNAMMDSMWRKGLKRRAKSVMLTARGLLPWYKRPRITKSKLLLELRGLSLGAAQVAVLDFLASVVQAGLYEDVKVVLVTGTGNGASRLQGDSDVATRGKPAGSDTTHKGIKKAVSSTLAELGSPFAETPPGSGKLVARLDEVVVWRSLYGMSSALMLDNMQPYSVQ